MDVGMKGRRTLRGQCEVCAIHPEREQGLGMDAEGTVMNRMLAETKFLENEVRG